MKKRYESLKLNTIDDFFKSEEQRQNENLEKVQILPASEIYPYSRQPYQTERPTADLAQLMDSIEQIGISEPLIVRPRQEGGYEIVSGHRRNYCATVIGLEERPVIVRNYTDEEADILVVDHNIKREDLLPSEKAKAYKLRLDAMKRQGERTDLTSAQNGQKLGSKYSVELLAEQVEESRVQIQRYVRLNYLVPELLEMVDQKKLKFIAAADYISHLYEQEQHYLAELMMRDEVSPSVEQARQLKALSEKDQLTEDTIDRIVRSDKDFEVKVVLKNDRLKKYFPKDYTPQRMEEVILKLLEEWHRKQIMRNRDIGR